MTRFKKFGLFAAPALALVALSGCATSFKADVARFQQLPAPAGQSYTIVADNPQLAGGLEFAHYADMVGQRLAQTGYVAASDPARADLIVRVAYDVDNGREKVRSTGFGGPYGAGFGGPWGGGFGVWHDTSAWNGGFPADKTAERVVIEGEGSVVKVNGSAWTSASKVTVGRSALLTVGPNDVLCLGLASAPSPPSA